MSPALDVVTSGFNHTVLQKTLHELNAGLRVIYPENTPRIILYGSYARNEATEDSDMDILLVFPQSIRPGTEIDRISPLLAELNLRYQMLISVYPVTSQQYHNAVGPFWRNIRRDGIEIHEN